MVVAVAKVVGDHGTHVEVVGWREMKITRAVSEPPHPGPLPQGGEGEEANGMASVCVH